MKNLGDHSMDMPFVPFETAVPGDQIDLTGMAVAGGLVILGAVIPLEDGNYPALVFKFVDPHGRPYPPMVFVTDEDQANKLVPLVQAAVEAAVRVAKEMDG